MSGPGNKAKLAKNPTLKDINWYKKQVTWGELPPFYHLVASSVGESEGVLTHGFDNAIKKILNKRNWNLEALGGSEDDQGVIVCDNPPRLALETVFTDRGFELHAFPYAKSKKIDQYVKENRLMEFKVWDPYDMKVIMRINQLHKFIEYYFKHGDDADKALIIHAHKIVAGVITFLEKNMNVQQVGGVTIKQMFELSKSEFGQDDDALMSILQGSLDEARPPGK